MLTLKNPDNTFDKPTLLRVIHSLSKSIGFAMPEIYWFETGRFQNGQIHIHSIIKKKLTPQLIPQYSKTFKSSKTTIISISHDEHGDPVLLENKVNHKNLIFHLSPITSKGHFLEVTEVYRFKEADYRCDFLDSPKPYTLSESSIPFVK
jgi:hypothetical protein